MRKLKKNETIDDLFNKKYEIITRKKNRIKNLKTMALSFLCMFCLILIGFTTDTALIIFSIYIIRFWK